MYLTYLDYLPKLSQELVDECLAVMHTNPLTKTLYYCDHVCPPKTLTFLRPHFNAEEYHIRMFSLNNTLLKHVDGRRVAYNYILDTGGINVATCFYGNKRGWNNEDPPLSESYIIEPFRWHRLEVDVNHDVANVTHPRLGITIAAFKDMCECT